MSEYSQLRVDEVAIDQIGSITVVRFRGHRFTDVVEIEKLGKELYRVIEERVRRKLVLDFSGVEFFSSAAIGKLISLNGRVKAQSGRMKLCNVPPEILEVFHVCKLDSIFDIRQDKADAMLSFEN